MVQAQTLRYKPVQFEELEVLANQLMPSIPYS